MTKTETVVNGALDRTELRDVHPSGTVVSTTILHKSGRLTVTKVGSYSGDGEVAFSKYEVADLIAQLRQHGLLPSPAVSS